MFEYTFLLIIQSTPFKYPWTAFQNTFN